jgi:hypothetical protein
MPVSAHQEARPRSTGEILDDAWFLYLAQAPLVLAACGLFLVPAAAALILVFTQPFQAYPWTRLLLPALAAFLLPLVGLGAGACQEAFHLGTEERPVTLGRCLGEALRRWLNHLASEALVLILPMLALLCLFVPDMALAGRLVLAAFLLMLAAPVWLMGLARHTVLTAGQKDFWRAWRLARRAVGRNPGRALVLGTARLLLFGVALLNLHLFVRLGLWAGDQLLGVNLSYVSVLLSLGNASYVLLLAALAWWFLTPYNEAVTYLFLVDARTRYEGLDLRYQIEQVFPLPRAQKVGVGLLLVLGGVLAAVGPVQASGRLAVVQQARQDVAAIRRQAEDVKNYPGGQHWREPLEQVAHRLDPRGDAQTGRYRWFFQALEKLGQADQAADLKILRSLEVRLAGLEQSLTWQPRQGQAGKGGRAPSAQDIRRLVPPGETTPIRKQEEEKPPVEKEKPGDLEKLEFRQRAAPPAVLGGSVGPALSGLGYLCLAVFLVLLAVVVVVGVVVLIRNWRKNRSPAKAPEQGVNQPVVEAVLEEPDRQNVAGLWRQSDELARAGRFLEAVRTLYLAVLALLHQGGLIRYERTRTNGEYADQLRRKSASSHRPFLGLTGLFEVKWYGQRSCQSGDYQACRELADTIQSGVRDQGSGVRSQESGVRS